MKRSASLLLGCLLAGTMLTSAQGYQAWITTDGAGIVFNSDTRPSCRYFYNGYCHDDDCWEHHRKHVKHHYKKAHKKARKAAKKYRKAQKKYYKEMRKAYRHHHDWDDDD